MPPIPPACADAEQRFQTFVSTPPVTNLTTTGHTRNLFDTDTMRGHIEFVKKTHNQLVGTDPENDDIEDYREWYGKRAFYKAISQEAHFNIIDREHGIYEDDNDEDDPDPAIRVAYRDSKTALRTWFREAERLHNAVVKCLPNVKNQLMGEQISRQTKLYPDVMKNIMEFANAKDPKRIVLDSAANRGVALPRIRPGGIGVALPRIPPGGIGFGTTRRNVPNLSLPPTGGRRTRRTKRRGTSRRARR